MSAAFEVPRIRAQVFRRPADRADKACFFGEFVGGLRFAYSTEIGLKSGPH